MTSLSLLFSRPEASRTVQVERSSPISVFLESCTCQTTKVYSLPQSLSKRAAKDVTFANATSRQHHSDRHASCHARHCLRRLFRASQRVSSASAYRPSLKSPPLPECAPCDLHQQQGQLSKSITNPTTSPCRSNWSHRSSASSVSVMDR